MLCCILLAAQVGCDGGSDKRQVGIPPNPQRIVSLSPTVTEILYELGLGDRIIADTRYCDYPEDARNKEKAGDFLTVNEEKIVFLEPDLVIDTTSRAHEKMWQRFNRAGIAVVDFDVNTLEGVYEAYEVIGRATGTEEKARKLLAELKDDLAELKDRCSRAESRPRVIFFIEYPNLTAVGKDTFIDRLLADIGCVNVVTQSGWPQNFPRELVVDLKPDVIIHAVDGNVLTEAYAAEIREGWSRATTVPAVADGRIYVVNGDTATRPGPRVIEGWTEIARHIHPELFDRHKTVP